MTDLKSGDIVEIIVGEENIDSPHIFKGQRGTVVSYDGEYVWIGYGFLAGGVYTVDFDGLEHLCCRSTLRKVPPDSDAGVTTWDKVPWKPAKAIH